MKKSITKRALAFMLSLVLAATMLAPVTTEPVKAATKYNWTMYKGESLIWTPDYGTIKSVKSSKKSVVKVSKNKETNYKIDITCKKKGKAKVTIKTSYGTTILNITVKKANMSVEVSALEDGYYLLTLNNNSKQTFDSVYVKYDLKDAEGNTKKSETVDFDDVVAGGTAYETVYVGTSTEIDVSNSSAEVTGVSHQPYETYKNQKGNLEVEDNETYGEKLELTYTNKSSKVNITGLIYVLWLDETGEIIDIRKVYVYVYAGSTDTYTVSYLPSGYASYKLVKSVYSASY